MSHCLLGRPTGHSGRPVRTSPLDQDSQTLLLIPLVQSASSVQGVKLTGGSLDLNSLRLLHKHQTLTAKPQGFTVTEHINVLRCMDIAHNESKCPVTPY